MNKMTNNQTDENGTEQQSKRGQVGIGTLIVFIAMVLVAAIAAGVLINTAGFLQTQAESTGTESTEQVSNNLNVITSTGNVSANDTINQVRIGVQPASGADKVNLAKLTIQYVSEGEFANLVVGNDSGSQQAQGDADPDNIGLTTDFKSQENYLIEVITAENENDVVMTDSSDRYEIVIPLDDENLNYTDYPVYNATGADVGDGSKDAADNGNLEPLSEGEEVELTITTEVGAQTVAFLKVPDSLSGDTAGSTVSL